MNSVESDTESAETFFFSPLFILSCVKLILSKFLLEKSGFMFGLLSGNTLKVSCCYFEIHST